MAATNCSRKYLCTICWAITVTAPALVLPHTLSLSLRAEASIVPLLASKRASCLMHMPDIRPQTGQNGLKAQARPVTATAAVRRSDLRVS